jgi:hypothetical protein
MLRFDDVWWDDNFIICVLHKHAGLVFMMLAHWNNSPPIDMSLGSGDFILIPSHQVFGFIS